MSKGILYIIATPIGNMGDITKRAVEILTTVDFVACEDTRVAGGLFHQLNIKKELVSLHQHSSDEKIGFIIRELKAGKSVAYVSDNGTPGISDPGQKLVQTVRGAGVKIFPVPGASALTAAVSVSGMVEKEFYFVGFLPKKKGRETKFKELAELSVPVVIYESAPRLERTLNDIKKYFGENTKVFIAREMTKKFEEYWDGNIDDILSDLENHQIKGEFVLIFK
ncbi:MAG: 16S rRNA (cytidine(1402)-2'-O)-methyltransferase [Patescibacteria group bacterium]